MSLHIRYFFIPTLHFHDQLLCLNNNDGQMAYNWSHYYHVLVNLFIEINCHDNLSFVIFLMNLCIHSCIMSKFFVFF
jgi:hypothetical protein